MWGSYTEVHLITNRDQDIDSFGKMDDPSKLWLRIDIAVNDNEVEAFPS